METELEHILNNSTKDEMVSYIKKHPSCFDEAIALSISDKSPYCWRAVWALNSSIKKNDPRISPFIQKVIDCFPSKDDGHQREIIRLLMKMKLDEDQEGYLYDHCVTVWEQISKQSSVRYFAILFILDIVKKYPDLQNEIKVLTEDHYLEPISPGIRKSIIKQIKTIPLS